MRLASWPWLLLAIAPAPAFADLTATYVASNPRFSLTVEIGANGDVRTGDSRQRQYFIMRSDEAYWVQVKPGRPIVMRVSDVLTIVAEFMKSAPTAPGERTETSVPLVVRNGGATIDGRVGDAYYAEQQDDAVSTRPLIVISHDPVLAPLGRALARQFALSRAMAGQKANAAQSAMVELLQSGAPLVFPDGELRSVTLTPIAAARFELPALPLSLDEVRRELKSSMP